MNSEIKLYRVILNTIYYIFYVLIISILFSFIFPTILVILGKKVIDPSDPIFDTIQIIIFILVLLFSFIFRKYLYLPIKTEKIEKLNIKPDNIKNKEIVEEKNKKEEKLEVKKSDIEEIKEGELDIKIGKEIK